jgi:hypothetical protein
VKEALVERTAMQVAEEERAEVVKEVEMVAGAMVAMLMVAVVLRPVVVTRVVKEMEAGAAGRIVERVEAVLAPSVKVEKV